MARATTLHGTRTGGSDGRAPAVTPIPEPSRTRRRGDVLDAAIRAATLEVLAEVGFDRLTMDLVADRAQTGKRVLYRRWADKADLVVDALAAALGEQPFRLPDTGSLRSDLVAYLTDSAALLSSRDGNLMTRLALEVGACSQLREAGHGRLWDRRRQLISTIIERAIARGEARPGALSAETATVGIALLFMRTIVDGRRLKRAEIEAIVDNAWLPALEPVGRRPRRPSAPDTSPGLTAGRA